MLNALISSILTFIIFFTPLAFGSVHLWAETIVSASILLLFFIYMIKSISEGRIGYKKDNILYAFFLFFASYALLQIIFKITKYPYNTYVALKITLLCFALFFVVLNWLRSRDALDALIHKIILVGFTLSVLGIAQFITGASKIYWIKQTPTPNFFGSFIHENLFACYISIVALITLGKILADSYSAEKINWKLSIKQITLRVLEDTLNKKKIFIVFSFIIMVAALFLSKSRAGIIFFSASVLFLISSISLMRYAKKAMVLMIFSLIFIALILSWVGFEKTFNEIKTIFQEQLDNGRINVYIDALNIFKEYPLTGIGLGAFYSIFPSYQSWPVKYFYKYLHNDILQFLIEFGIAGFAVASLLFIIFLGKLIMFVRKTPDPYRYCIGLSIVSIFFYLALHTSTDFGLHIMAISSLTVIYLAIGSLVMRDSFTEEGVMVIRSKRALYITSSALFICALIILLKPLIAEILVEGNPSRDKFGIAMALDPGNDNLCFREYKFMIGQAGKGYISERAAYDEAKILLDKAMELNPYKTTYMIARGEIELWSRDYGIANNFFKKALLNEPYNPIVQMAYAYALFCEGLDEKDSARRRIILRQGAAYYKIAKDLDEKCELKSVVKNPESYAVLINALKIEGIEAR